MTGIVTYILVDVDGKLVGKYTSPMDPVSFQFAL